MTDKLAVFPFDEFMMEFLPRIEGEPNDDAFDNMFDALPTHREEVDICQPFVSDNPSTPS